MPSHTDSMKTSPILNPLNRKRSKMAVQPQVRAYFPAPISGMEIR